MRIRKFHSNSCIRDAKKAQVIHGTSHIRLPLLHSCSDGVCRRSAAWHLGIAERGGFEPPVPFGHARLPSVYLKPLGHLS